MTDTNTYDYRVMPKKRLSAGVLFLNRNQEILLVKPAYREGWLLPGGVIDEDESPKYCAEREIQEELGIRVVCDTLLLVDYLHKKSTTQTEAIHFLFKGIMLSETEAPNLKINDPELEDIAFFSLEKAQNNIVESSRNRLVHALASFKDGRTRYLEDGKLSE